MPDKVNLDYLKLVKCEFQKYEVLTMSVAGGQPQKKKKKRAKPSYKATKHIERTSLHFTSDDIAGKMQLSAWFLNEEETVVSSNAITFLASNRSFSVSDSSQSSQRMVTIYGLQKASSGRMGRRISAVGPRNGRSIHSSCSKYYYLIL